MGITQAIAVSSVQLFKLRLLGRMQAMSRQTGAGAFTVPVALLLLHDQANGGAVTGLELERWFGLQDFELPNLMDLYFLGWSRGSGKPAEAGGAGMQFDLASCEGFRSALRGAAIRDLAGHASLILVDCQSLRGTVRLNFTRAACVDLTAVGTRRHLATVGGWLQSLAELIAALQAGGQPDADRPFRVGDPLPLASGSGPLAGWLLERWARHAGAPALTANALRDLGPDLPLIEF